MHIPALTSLRFIAALMVVLSHLAFLEASSSTTVRWLQTTVFKEGYIGVTFFFILSGFILAHSYERRFSEGEISAREFLRARIARIIPLHILTFTLAAILILQLSNSVWLSHFVSVSAVNLGLLQSFVPSSEWYFSLNAPSWSLSAEVFFYVLFPALIVLRTQFLLIFALFISIVKAALLAFPDENAHFLQYIFPPLRLADFVLGIAAYRVASAHRARLEAMAGQLQVASIALLALALSGSTFVSQAARYDLYYLVPMCFIVVAFSLSQGWLSKRLSDARLVLLGEASFSLYMIHYLVIMAGEQIRAALYGAGSNDSDVFFAVVYILLSVAASVGLFRYFELPAKRAVLTRFRGRNARLTFAD